MKVIMNKKKIIVIVMSCILLAAVCVGVSFAIWGSTLSSDKETGVNSGDWTETEKYINFGVVLKPGSAEQIGWSVIGLNNPQKVITVPKEHRASGKSQSYPVIEIASSFSNISGVEQVNLHNSIKVIHTNAFARFADLKIVKIESGATFEIGNSAFSACDVLQEFDYSGSKITNIGIDAFMGCTKLLNKPTV